jgi:hypothetical protein
LRIGRVAKPRNRSGYFETRSCDGVVGLRGELDRERRLEGLWAGGGVREDLHVDPRRVHSGDAPLAQVVDACRPAALRVRLEASGLLPDVVDQFARIVPIRLLNSRKLVVLLETDDLHGDALLSQ